MRGTMLCLLMLWMAGCVVATSEREQLPTGVTLLGSDEADCDGPIQIEGDPDVQVDPGETTVVVVDDDDDIDWQCMAEAIPDAGELDCPAGTSYVRITREQDESDFTMECYGS